MRRRPGESSGTRPLYGPPICIDDTMSCALTLSYRRLHTGIRAGPSPSGLTASVLTMVTTTCRRPDFTGTRASSASSAANSRLLASALSAALNSGPPPTVKCPTRTPSTRISISFGTFRPRIRPSQSPGVCPIAAWRKSRKVSAKSRRVRYAGDNGGNKRNDSAPTAQPVMITNNRIAGSVKASILAMDHKQPMGSDLGLPGAAIPGG